MSSRIEQIIEEIEEYIDSCKFQPLSTSKIIVNKDQMDELLRELRMKTPDEIKRYQKIIANKDAILADAQAKAESLIEDAQIQTTELGSLLPFENPDLSPLLLSPLEMTTGVVSICQSSLAFCWKYIFSLALISFGGFCCLVQTASMLQGSGLSIVPYITQKLITAVVTSLLALCYCFFFIN